MLVIMRHKANIYPNNDSQFNNCSFSRRSVCRIIYGWILVLTEFQLYAEIRGAGGELKFAVAFCLLNIRMERNGFRQNEIPAEGCSGKHNKYVSLLSLVIWFYPKITYCLLNFRLNEYCNFFFGKMKLLLKIVLSNIISMSL